MNQAAQIGSRPDDTDPLMLHPPSVARFASGAGFIAGLITLLVIAAACGPLRTPGVIMCLSGAISLGALMHTIFVKESSPIQFTSFIYLVFFFQLPGIIHLGTMSYPWFGVTYPEWAETRAAVVVLVFTIGLLAGTRLGRRSSAVPKADPLRRASGISVGAIYASILGTCALSIVSGLAVGYGAIRASRGEAAELFDAPSPLTLILSTLATNGAFIALALALLNWKRLKVSRVVSTVSLSIALITFLLANNILALPRYAIGAYVIALFFAWRPQGTRSKAALMLTLLTAQFTIFPILSEAARGGGVEAFHFDPIDYISNHGDFDGFQSTINVVLYVTGTGLIMGKQLLSAALFFVPRYLFPTKSIGLGGDSATFVGYRFVNISSPLPSELYADFGLLGLAVLSTLVGFLIARLDRQYTRAADQGDMFGLLTPSVIAGYSFIIMRGSLVGVLGPVIVTVVLALIVCSLIGRPAPSGAAAEGAKAFS